MAGGAHQSDDMMENLLEARRLEQRIEGHRFHSRGSYHLDPVELPVEKQRRLSELLRGERRGSEPGGAPTRR